MYEFSDKLRIFASVWIWNLQWFLKNGRFSLKITQPLREMHGEDPNLEVTNAAHCTSGPNLASRPSEGRVEKPYGYTIPWSLSLSGSESKSVLSELPYRYEFHPFHVHFHGIDSHHLSRRNIQLLGTWFTSRGIPAIVANLSPWQTRFFNCKIGQWHSQ